MLRYSSELEYLVRVTKPSGRSNTFINYFAKPLEYRAIITRRHNFSSTSRKQIEKKNNFCFYETDKYLFYFSLRSKRETFPCSIHKVLDKTNSNTSLFNKLHEIYFDANNLVQYHVH